MSLSKPKDRFDRFGDDLAEVVLSYLQFEDRFRFECVSKQFQNLVFRRQLDLIIDNKIEKRLEFKNVFGDIVINLTALQMIIKKCHFIKSIKCLDSTKLFEIKLIHVINSYPKYIPHLNCVVFNHLNNEQTFMDFFTKFGQQLKSLNFRPLSHMNVIYSGFSQFLNLCPNLTALILRQFYVSEAFGNLLANYKSIKHLDINCYGFTDNLLKQIKGMTQIESLRIRFPTFDACLSETLKEIVSKCIYLKSFFLTVDSIPSDLQLVAFNSIKGFKNIKRIHLVFNNNVKSTTIWPKDVFSSDSLKNWLNVTHLSLYLDQIFDTLFDDIDKYLPKLQYLNIWDKNVNLSNKTIESLAKLQKMKAFILNINSNTEVKTSITESDVNYLIKKCPKIKKIQLNCGFWQRYPIKWKTERSLEYNEQQINEIKTK